MCWALYNLTLPPSASTPARPCSPLPWTLEAASLPSFRLDPSLTPSDPLISLATTGILLTSKSDHITLCISPALAPLHPQVLACSCIQLRLP